MTTWHAPPEVLARFTAAPEAVDDVTASSVEAHLLACDACRRGLAAAAAPEVVASSWEAVAEAIDRPRRSWSERALARVVPDHTARLVSATPALRLAWLAAVAVVVTSMALVARDLGSLTPYLVFAPLVPLAGVGVSFGLVPDPAAETALATPMYGAGLVLHRTVAVLASSTTLLAAGAAVLPGFELRHFAWALPSVGLCALALCLSTWVAPVTAAGASAAGWFAVVEAAVVLDHSTGSLAQGQLFGPVGQSAFAVVCVVAALGIATRRDHLSMLEVQ